MSTSLPHQALPSFPTRRSSDLTRADPLRRPECDSPRTPSFSSSNLEVVARDDGDRARATTSKFDEENDGVRSEEHTSELQSHSDLVCRLLLEKKKKTTSI